MKKLILFLTTVIVISGIQAQSNKEDIDMIQAMYGKEKKEIMASFIELEGAKKTEFWKLYDEYETSRKALGRKRITLLEKYAKEYETNDDKKIDAMMKEIFALQSQTDKLIVTYYDKMKLKAGYKAAAQFSQLEAYLLSQIRAALLEEIPFFGQLDDK
jgi:hypothetical protein